MHKAIRTLAGLAGLAVATAASALDPELGTIEPRSSAGEPVSARIPLRGVTGEELSRLEVGLASRRVFERAGIDRQPELSRLSFEVVAEGEGAPYIAVRSDEPIDRPLLDFIVELDWPQGSLVREHTLLLEEPTSAGTAPAQAASRGSAAAGAEGGEPAGPYGPVRDGETLWSIAERHRPDESVTIAQTMLAIKALNPEAFYEDNVNSLLRGARLEMPSKEQIERISADQAQATYERQLAAWVPPAERGGGQGPPEQEAPEEARSASASTDDGPGAPQRAQLRIVAPGEGDGEEVLSLLDTQLEPSEANVRRLQGALAALREEQSSLHAKRDNLEARVTDLRERVAALERLVDLRMEGVLPPPAQAQQEQSDIPIPEPSGAQGPDAEADEGTEPEPAPDEGQEGDASEGEGESSAREEGGAEEGLSAASLWRNEGLRNGALLAAGAALIGISAALGLRRRRKRGSGDGQAEAGLDLDSLGADLGTASGRRDPLTVADEYLADEALGKAQEILERGIDREPQREDLRLRLLEVLARREDRAEFLGQAQALHDRAHSEDDPFWQAALALGRRFTPDAALFAGAAQAVAGGAGEADEEAGPAATAQTADGDEAAEEAKPELEALDLGLEPEAEGPGAEAPADEGEGRLGDEAPSAGPEPAMAQAPEASAEAQGAADELFGNADEVGAEAPAAEEGASGQAQPGAAGDEAAELEEMDLDSLLSEEQEGEGLDYGDEAEEETAVPGPGEGDEADTKIDLARAYVDLGDEAGARELLEEVIEEGAETQRENARRILAELSGE